MKFPLSGKFNDRTLFIQALQEYTIAQDAMRQQLKAMFADAEWQHKMPFWDECIYVDTYGEIEQKDTLEPVLNNLAGALGEREVFPLEVAKVKLAPDELGVLQAFVVRYG